VTATTAAPPAAGVPSAAELLAPVRKTAHCIVDNQLWTSDMAEGAKGLYNWEPPPPPFLAPEDLAALMAGAHTPN